MAFLCLFALAAAARADDHTPAGRPLENEAAQARLYCRDARYTLADVSRLTFLVQHFDGVPEEERAKCIERIVGRLVTLRSYERSGFEVTGIPVPLLTLLYAIHNSPAGEAKKAFETEIARRGLWHLQFGPQSWGFFGVNRAKTPLIAQYGEFYRPDPATWTKKDPNAGLYAVMKGGLTAGKLRMEGGWLKVQDPATGAVTVAPDAVVKQLAAHFLDGKDWQGDGAAALELGVRFLTSYLGHLEGTTKVRQVQRLAELVSFYETRSRIENGTYPIDSRPAPKLADEVKQALDHEDKRGLGLTFRVAYALAPSRPDRAELTVALDPDLRKTKLVKSAMALMKRFDEAEYRRRFEAAAGKIGLKPVWGPGPKSAIVEAIETWMEVNTALADAPDSPDQRGSAYHVQLSIDTNGIRDGINFASRLLVGKGFLPRQESAFFLSYEKTAPPPSATLLWSGSEMRLYVDFAKLQDTIAKKTPDKADVRRAMAEALIDVMPSLGGERPWATDAPDYRVAANRRMTEAQFNSQEKWYAGAIRRALELIDRWEAGRPTAAR